MNKLVNMCKTRWVLKLDALYVTVNLLSSVVEVYQTTKLGVGAERSKTARSVDCSNPWLALTLPFH